VLVVHERGRVLRLPHVEIVSLRAEQKTVLVRTAAASYVLDETLADLEQRLGEAFLRVHRNALVARTAVRALELRPDAPQGGAGGPGDGWAVQLSGTGEWFAVSRRQLPTVKAALDEGAARG
jgi:two-component system response regulator AlgR